MTLLSILGSHAVALPLSPSFPANELRYALNQSQASTLISSSKYQEHAEEVLHQGLLLEVELRVLPMQRQQTSKSSTSERVQLRDAADRGGGLMLYTSGTTNQPVR